jgi:uncharacterized protein
VTHRLAALGTCVLAVLLATGCSLFGSADPDFYTLSSSAPSVGSPIASRPELGIAVGPIEIPRYLDRPELITRDGSHRLVVNDLHRWAGSLRTDVTRVVADDLGQLLGSARVVMYPTEPRFAATYRVLLDVREFEAEAAAKVSLRARWTITAFADGRALAVEESQIDQPLASDAPEDVVAAQSSALAALAREIAARIASLDAH